MNTATQSRTRPRSEDTAMRGVIWLALMAGAVALLGGSARFDAVQMAALRPLAALFLIPALYFLSKESLRPALAPMVMLGLATLWMAIQLVPLPPSLWHALPGREILVELDAMHGLEDTWRPIAWVPMRGWNALMSMVVPISAALLVLALRPNMRSLLLIIVAIGVVDAALGLLQILAGSESALYYYTHTNAGSPVGIFANENHSAVFSAMVLLVIARVGFSQNRPEHHRFLNIGLAIAFVIVTLAVLVSGSRAGLGLALVALAASALMAWLWLKRPQMEGAEASRLAVLARHPRLVVLFGIVAVAGLLYALLQFERAPGVIDALNQDAFEDLRWQVGPILGQMMANYWLLGTGFGSFDAVYMIYEPTRFQGPAYLNQAHNDWAQLVIEGGVPAILLVLGMLRWFAFALRSLYARNAAALARCVFWTTLIAAIAVASLVDYPLRTPIFQMVGAWLVVALGFDVSDNIEQKPRKSN